MTSQLNFLIRSGWWDGVDEITRYKRNNLTLVTRIDRNTQGIRDFLACIYRNDSTGAKYQRVATGDGPVDIFLFV